VAYDHLKIASYARITSAWLNALVDILSRHKEELDRKVNRELDSDIVPVEDSRYSIGAPARRLKEVYALAVHAGDLVLGGRYAVAEGEDGLYVVDRVKGKKYRIVMVEVGG